MSPHHGLPRPCRVRVATQERGAPPGSGGAAPGRRAADSPRVTRGAGQVTASVMARLCPVALGVLALLGTSLFLQVNGSNAPFTALAPPSRIAKTPPQSSPVLPELRDGHEALSDGHGAPSRSAGAMRLAAAHDAGRAAPCSRARVVGSSRTGHEPADHLDDRSWRGRHVRGGRLPVRPRPARGRAGHARAHPRRFEHTRADASASPAHSSHARPRQARAAHPIRLYLHLRRGATPPPPPTPSPPWGSTTSNTP